MATTVTSPERTREAAPAFAVPWLLRLPYPVRNMLRRWRGLLGMMVGVGIALSIGMTILAVVQAELNLFTGAYRTTGANVYVATKGGKLIALLPGDTPGTIKQATHALAEIRALPDVRGALGVIDWTLEREQEGPKLRNAPAQLLAAAGVDGDPNAVPNELALTSGRWFRHHNEVVLGPKVARERSLGVGSTIRLNNHSFEVVGVGKLRGAGLSSDSLIYLDAQTLRQIGDLGDVLNQIEVVSAQPERTRAQIGALGGFSTFSSAELVQQAEEADAAGVAIDWILILLTLAIGGLFVSSMLSHSVSERRIDFATLRAIGIPARTILFTVAAEAILITVVASTLGVVISLAFGLLINAYAAPSYGFESLYDADAGLFLLIFGLAVGLGIVSGLFPARRATRVDPVEVLREA
jgi:putative ABC transport system permease protein